MKQLLKTIKTFLKDTLFPTPKHLLKNQIELSDEKLKQIEDSLNEHFYKEWRSHDKLSDEQYKKDLDAHLRRRINSDRNLIVPWIDDATSLKGKKILEIGCGTGSSTIALAEQGAIVTGLDIDEDALHVARKRAEVYGVNANFESINADKFSNRFEAGTFDIVIFFACLEHMTIQERLIFLCMICL